VTGAAAQQEQVAVQPRTRRRLSLGPGLVFLLTVVGTGDFVSNSAAGATYGYGLIWALALSLTFRFVWVNTSAKYVLVTGESLLQGYGRLGHWILWVVLAAVAVFRHATNLYKVVLMGTTAHLLLPLPMSGSAIAWSLLFVFLGFAAMFWGGYPLVERGCKFFVALLGGSMFAAALLSTPDPAEMARGLIPSFPENAGAYSVILLLSALVGTEAGSMTNVTYAYFIHAKGWRDVSFLRRQRFDLAVSVVCMFLMGVLLQVAAAETIRPLGITPQSTDDLVRIFSDTQGRAGLIICAVGLWSAAFSSFVGGTTGYGLIVTDIWRSFIRPGSAAAADPKRDPVYRWAIVFWSFSPLYILLTGVGPVWLVLVVSAVVVGLIPVLALCLLRLTNDAALMGKYRNGWFTNATLVLLVLVSLGLIFRNAAELWPKMAAWL
jgi:Mn2+/Fe2+ NRAMP family transporter